jgi:hypothetical protein
LGEVNAAKTPLFVLEQRGRRLSIDATVDDLCVPRPQQAFNMSQPDKKTHYLLPSESWLFRLIRSCLLISFVILFRRAASVLSFSIFFCLHLPLVVSKWDDIVCMRMSRSLHAHSPFICRTLLYFIW